MITKRMLLAAVILSIPLAAQSFCPFGKGGDRIDRSQYNMPAIGFSPAWYPTYPYTPVTPSVYQDSNQYTVPPDDEPVFTPAKAAVKF